MATTSITIAKSTGARIAITDAKGTSYSLLSSLVTLRSIEDDVVLEFYAGGDKLRVLRLDFEDITSPLATSIGDCTFDYTGGAQEDLWTKTTHGLAVGDSVIFTAVGTGATEYEIDTQYFVITVPTSGTFQLSDELGGSVIEGTADSVGTWTLGRFSAQNIVDVLDALLVA